MRRWALGNRKEFLLNEGFMSISAMTNAGVQPPSMASLLRINKINAVNGQDADGDADGSSSTPTVPGAQKSIAPKLVKATLEALNQLGANVDINTANQSHKSASADEVKKSALGFVTSVLSELGSSEKSSKYSNAADQVVAGVAQMTSAVANGVSPAESVNQSANALFKAAGLSSNSSSIANLLSSLQKSLVDGMDSGSLINLTA
ncbi:hypothetical protein DCO17_02975 [Polynucleobacter tropicus]|uniref:Uncharacterized protein n=1 Tax=Polynucleobacter tropicus TaxID=1743174 RepID=A0A6M9PZA8_9BURK|nr:hypothetical protein [Polynucleobacter tropicus]QKM64287.1 hypothetical protein DCO17_02975 [Polynucleobacter tropicus]